MCLACQMEDEMWLAYLDYVAQQEKLGAIGVADAQRENAIQVSNATKLKEIGTREAHREQAVRVAQLDKEQKVGEQTATFERDAQTKAAERDMRIAVADANAKAIAGEKPTIPKPPVPKLIDGESVRTLAARRIRAV